LRGQRARSVRGRRGRFCVDGRGGGRLAALVTAALQRLEQIDAFLALQLELPQRVHEGLLGRRRRAGERGPAVGVVVGDVVEGGPPGAQCFGLVALRFEVDGRRAGEEGLVVGLLRRVGAHCLSTKQRAGGVVVVCRRLPPLPAAVRSSAVVCARHRWWAGAMT
jgi:hypothetical protein